LVDYMEAWTNMSLKIMRKNSFKKRKVFDNSWCD
jgi:hypothetical protein